MIAPFAASLALLATLLPQVSPLEEPETTNYIHYDLLRHRDRVEADGSVASSMEVRVLMRTAAAVAELGQVEAYYVEGYGDVAFEEVFIEKPDGRRVEVTDGLIEDLNPFGVTATSLSADIRIKKLTIPGLEPGDWLSYRVVTLRKSLATGFIYGEMKLSPVVGDPVQIYELDLPRGTDVRVQLREGLAVDWEAVPAPADRFVRRLSLKVEQPATDEQWLSAESLQVAAEPDVSYTSFPSWSAVAEWWWQLSRDRLVPNDTVEAEAARLVLADASPRDALAALHGFVASRIRYVNVSFGLGRMQPRRAADVLSNRYGDCKDKHALLAALAAAAGIDVRPVLVHSVRPDLIDDVPGPQQFDHMISVVRLGSEPEEWLWLDATNPFGPPGYLQPDLRDKRALLILFRLRSDEEMFLRSTFAAVTQNIQAQAVQASFGRGWDDGTVSGVQISDPADISQPFTIAFDAERRLRPDESRGRLRLPLPPVLTLPPIDQAGPAPSEVVVHADIQIPSTTSARSPRSISVDQAFGGFESQYTVDGQHLRLTRTLRLARRPRVDEREAYEALRSTLELDAYMHFPLLERHSGAAEQTSSVSPHTEGRFLVLPMSGAGKGVTQRLQADEGFIEAKISDIPEDVSLCICIGTKKSCFPFCGHDSVVSGAISVSRSDEGRGPGDYLVQVYTYPFDASRTRDIPLTLTLTYPPLAPPPPPPVATKVRQALEPLKGQRVYRVNSHAVQGIVAMGREAVPELLAILGEVGFADSRFALYAMGAAEALEELATEDDRPALVALLADGHHQAAGPLSRFSGPDVRDALLVPLAKGYVSPDLTRALGPYKDEPRVQDALVAYLETFGLADDYVPGYVAELVAKAGIREAVPVLTRLVDDARPGAPARRMFASALVDLHDPAGIPVLIEIFQTTTGDRPQDSFERHGAGEALNRVVGDQLYVSAPRRSILIESNFEEAAERFAGWWDEAQGTIRWDEERRKWTW